MNNSICFWVRNKCMMNTWNLNKKLNVGKQNCNQYLEVEQKVTKSILKKITFQISSPKWTRKSNSYSKNLLSCEASHLNKWVCNIFSEKIEQIKNNKSLSIFILNSHSVFISSFISFFFNFFYKCDLARFHVAMWESMELSLYMGCHLARDQLKSH